MDRSDHPKNQHYVPQFLLANFCIQGAERVFCYDKQQARIFQTNVRNIASEKWFYDLVEGKPELSLEQTLAELESVCSRIINGHILSKRTLRGLSHEDLGWLGLFVAIQMLRTTHIRESVRHMDNQLAKELSRRGLNIDTIENYVRINTEQAAKEFSLANLRSAGQLLPHILDKVWILYESKSQFLISDNPVGLQNTMNKSKHRGTLGLAVRGIEVYLPISPCYTIGLICQDTFNAFLAYFETHHQALDRVGSFELRNFVNSVRRRLPISCSTDNVENLNSIQVVAAERFIFSRDGNFDLAQEMIRNSPGLTIGPRMEIR